MTTIALRSTKFFIVFYGDEISEKEYYAKKMAVTVVDTTAVFTMELLELLDAKSFLNDASSFDTFVLDDSFLIKKIVSFLKNNSEIKFFSLKIRETNFRISKIKIDGTKVRFHLF